MVIHECLEHFGDFVCAPQSLLHGDLVREHAPDNGKVDCCQQLRRQDVDFFTGFPTAIRTGFNAHSIGDQRHHAQWYYVHAHTSWTPQDYIYTLVCNTIQYYT